MVASIWAAIGGTAAALGIIGTLGRISYQLGSLVTEFRAYVKLNDILVAKIDARVHTLEQRKR
jgi:hypothetical protein